MSGFTLSFNYLNAPPSPVRRFSKKGGGEEATNSETSLAECDSLVQYFEILSLYPLTLPSFIFVILLWYVVCTLSNIIIDNLSTLYTLYSTEIMKSLSEHTDA